MLYEINYQQVIKKLPKLIRNVKIKIYSTNKIIIIIIFNNNFIKYFVYMKRKKFKCFN